MPSHRHLALPVQGSKVRRQGVKDRSVEFAALHPALLVEPLDQAVCIGPEVRQVGPDKADLVAEYGWIRLHSHVHPFNLGSLGCHHGLGRHTDAAFP
jgi:hypothetical protein